MYGNHFAILDTYIYPVTFLGNKNGTSLACFSRNREHKTACTDLAATILLVTCSKLVADYECCAWEPGELEGSTCNKDFISGHILLDNCWTIETLSW